MTDENSSTENAFAAAAVDLDEASYFRTLVENTSDAILTLNEESTIIFANPAVERLLGYQPDELVGHSTTVIIPERLRQRHETALNRYLETDERSLDWDGTELPALHKNGHEVPVSITFREHNDSGHRLFTGIIRDISAQKTREQQLRHQRDTLERIRQVTESLRLTNQILVRASTRDEIEQMICDRLATSEAYAFAWIGDYISEHKQIEPHTWAGVEDDYLSEVEVTADESDTGYGPAGQAVRTRLVQIVQNIRTDSTFEPWRDEALQRGYRAVAAVPLQYGETIYGVLVIYSSRAFAFDEYEQTLLGELGERIGHAIHAVDNQQLLHTDTVVELTFQLTENDAVLIEASDYFECQLTLETITPVSNQGFVCYTTVEGAAPEDVCERLRETPQIDQARPVRMTGETGAIEYTITGGSPSVTLIEYGATIQSLTIEQGEATIIGEVAPDTNTRQIIEGMQTAHPEITFIAKQTRDRPAHSADEVDWHVLADILTTRQREVLEVAYHAGYFASPRETTGEELAEILDIASPTFYQHIRKSTQKLLDVILVDEQ
ncbi:bacterio-opsin activator domain-containing protein [Haladaptatus halobius]|uniref:bacterio-opsin activator domain-containing protein n=1 Tax=Haladaptatus halobius TaxID=2884875 RepID=UPI001D09D419|nr:bacterio-opsin activator domain-containing protein [Haladaptatus halobius]